VRAEILKIDAVTPQASLIKYAAEQIQAGQVLGMPTVGKGLECARKS